MKKKTNYSFIFAVVLLFLLSLSIISAIVASVVERNFKKHYYPQTMYVYQVDTIHDVVTFVDHNHELWQIEGVEDWDVGECASLIMFDNYTPEIKDDKIVRARYCGFSTCGEVPFVY